MHAKSGWTPSPWDDDKRGARSSDDDMRSYTRASKQHQRYASGKSRSVSSRRLVSTRRNPALAIVPKESLTTFQRSSGSASAGREVGGTTSAAALGPIATTGVSVGHIRVRGASLRNRALSDPIKMIKLRGNSRYSSVPPAGNATGLTVGGGSSKQLDGKQPTTGTATGLTVGGIPAVAGNSSMTTGLTVGGHSAVASDPLALTPAPLATILDNSTESSGRYNRQDHSPIQPRRLNAMSSVGSSRSRSDREKLELRRKMVEIENKKLENEQQLLQLQLEVIENEDRASGRSRSTIQEQDAWKEDALARSGLSKPTFVPVDAGGDSMMGDGPCVTQINVQQNEQHKTQLNVQNNMLVQTGFTLPEAASAAVNVGYAMQNVARAASAETAAVVTDHAERLHAHASAALISDAEARHSVAMAEAVAQSEAVAQAAYERERDKTVGSARKYEADLHRKATAEAQRMSEALASAELRAAAAAQESEVLRTAIREEATQNLKRLADGESMASRYAQGLEQRTAQAEAQHAQGRVHALGEIERLQTKLRDSETEAALLRLEKAAAADTSFRVPGKHLGPETHAIHTPEAAETHFASTRQWPTGTQGIPGATNVHDLETQPPRDDSAAAKPPSTFLSGRRSWEVQEKLNNLLNECSEPRGRMIPHSRTSTPERGAVGTSSTAASNASWKGGVAVLRLERVVRITLLHVAGLRPVARPLALGEVDNLRSL